jgi:hypothetical protein
MSDYWLTYYMQISHDSIYEIIRKRLGFHKACKMGPKAAYSVV